MFRNREEAGKLLGKKVFEILRAMPEFRPDKTVVVGLPRGGVPVAKQVAAALAVPLTILVSKKIGAPFQPELAIGAVCSSGVILLNKDLDYIIDDLKPYIESEKRRLTAVTKALEEKWTNAAGIQGLMNAKGKLVVLVDDGIATGMTILAAIKSLKASGASKIIVASPVISTRVAARLRLECDELITLLCPHEFQAIGQFYGDFHQVEDDEMISILKDYAEPTKKFVSIKT
jgi:putative phosphoribosyl transferase